MDIIKPRTLSGFMELLPQKQQKMEKMMQNGILQRKKGITGISILIHQNMDMFQENINFE